MLSGTAAKHHPAIRQQGYEAEVVRVVCRHFMPGSVLQVFGRGKRDIAVRMSAKPRKLSVQKKYGAASARPVKVRHGFYADSAKRHAFRLRSLPLFTGR
jgi:hypothetical protein